MWSPIYYLPDLAMGVSVPAPSATVYYLTDPDAATLINPGAAVAPHPPTTQCMLPPAVPGSARSHPLQSWYFGGIEPATYQASDILSASVMPPLSATPLFTPQVGWYTNQNTQTGYDQGQTVVTYSAAQAALLMPTITYTIEVERAPASDPTNTELIVRAKLPVERPAYAG
jgi:hypothetical protein